MYLHSNSREFIIRRSVARNAWMVSKINKHKKFKLAIFKFKCLKGSHYFKTISGEYQENMQKKMYGFGNCCQCFPSE